MATTRKTAKFYRETIVRTTNTSSLNTLIKEIVTKFGSDKSLYIGGAECNWNHWVKGFAIGKNGDLLIKVYWQGDSTDGNDYVSFNDVYGRGKSVIRAETYWDGYRTRYRHGDINVEKYEVEKLIKLLAEWLSPDAMKARKVAEELRKIKGEISSILSDAYFTKYARKWGNNEEFYNGKGAVNEWVEKQGNDLLKMEKVDIFAMVDKIFQANYKSDRYFGKVDMWSGRTKPYTISF